MMKPTLEYETPEQEAPVQWWEYLRAIAVDCGVFAAFIGACALVLKLLMGTDK